MAWVYILKSANVPKTYVGSTTDLDRRLGEHNSGKNTFTRRYMPWAVVYKEKFADLSSARIREHYLKSAAGRRWIVRSKIIPR